MPLEKFYVDSIVLRKGSSCALVQEPFIMGTIFEIVCKRWVKLDAIFGNHLSFVATRGKTKAIEHTIAKS